MKHKVLSLQEVDVISRKNGSKAALEESKFKDEGWIDVSKSMEVDSLPELSGGATIQNIDRSASAIDIFNKIYDIGFIERLKQFHEIKPTQGSDAFATHRILQYLAYRIYIQATFNKQKRGDGDGQVRGAFQKTSDHFKTLPGIDDNLLMCYQTWSKIFTKLYIPPQIAAHELSLRFQQFIQPGQFICLDEKNKKWRGASSCIRCLPSKTQKIGQWSSQYCVPLNDTGKSYCLGIYSFLSGANSQIVVNLADVFGYAVAISRKQPIINRPIICADDCFLFQCKKMSFKLESSISCGIKSK